MLFLTRFLLIDTEELPDPANNAQQHVLSDGVISHPQHVSYPLLSFSPSAFLLSVPHRKSFHKHKTTKEVNNKTTKEVNKQTELCLTMLPSRIKPLSTSHPPSQQPSKNKQPKPEPEDQDDEAEDHLSSFLHHLFPDEAPPCLGEPGQSLLYSSDLFGDLTVKLPDYSSSTTTTTTTDDHPESKGTQTEAEASITEENEQGDVETGRRLFAHYLWGGALVIAEGIEAATRIERESKDHILGEVADAKRWSVKGHKVLEVGAGTLHDCPLLSLAVVGLLFLASYGYTNSHWYNPFLYYQTIIPTRMKS